MLPSSKAYLHKGGLSPSAAEYTGIACFLGGVISIQVISRFLHHYIPSHVVDCDHSHEDDHLERDGVRPDEPTQEPSHTHSYEQNGHVSEVSPLLAQENPSLGKISISHQRPTIHSDLKSRVSTLVQIKKAACHEGGSCHGYSGLCAPECFEGIIRSPTRIAGRAATSSSVRRPSMHRNFTAPDPEIVQKLSTDTDEESCASSLKSNMEREELSQNNHQIGEGYQNHASLNSISKNFSDDLENNHDHKTRDLSHPDAHETNNQSHNHHHHVPTNAFLSIGLQTSIAIALHKLPEGFITFATNHANPKLGFAVFMALFIHNITEGFAMALPLYLALGSRWKAMFWSSLLGGITQPLGAGLAALWFKIAGRGDMAPGDTVYGCMFAITAGVMASVALQIFSESLGFTHNRNLCIAFAFIGMGILGFSFALTAS